jgi:hypothetical protein
MISFKRCVPYFKLWAVQGPGGHGGWGRQDILSQIRSVTKMMVVEFDWQRCAILGSQLEVRTLGIKFGSNYQFLLQEIRQVRVE